MPGRFFRGCVGFVIILRVKPPLSQTYLRAARGKSGRIHGLSFKKMK
jgi:hypothetical protein